MNKTELTAIVAEKCGVSKKDTQAAVNALFDAIENALAAGEKVQIAGFGSFETRQRAARTGKNPQTGDVTDMYLWLTIFGAALVSAAAVAGTSRRRNEN